MQNESANHRRPSANSSHKRKSSTDATPDRSDTVETSLERDMDPKKRDGGTEVSGVPDNNAGSAGRPSGNAGSGPTEATGADQTIAPGKGTPAPQVKDNQP